MKHTPKKIDIIVELIQIFRSLDFYGEILYFYNFFIFVPDQNTQHCHGNEQIDTEPANEVSVYSDASFEDERDCEVQSVMTYHSDVVDYLRLHSSIESESVQASKGKISI